MNTRRYSSLQEKTIARNLGGSVVGGSGSTPYSLGDVRTKHILIEAKTSVTPKRSYSVKLEVIEKLRKEAVEMGKYYCALAFNFGPNTENMYVIDEDLMRYLIQKLDEDFENCDLR